MDKSVEVPVRSILVLIPLHTSLYPITCVLAPVLYKSAVRPIAAALGMQKKNEGITLLRP